MLIDSLKKNYYFRLFRSFPTSVYFIWAMLATCASRHLHKPKKINYILAK